MPKTRKEKAMLKFKNSIRVIGKLPPKVKKWPTWEFELFKKIANERLWMWTELVKAKHITKYGFICEKFIHKDDLTVTNFSHIVSKWRDKTKRLDPNNIEVVSRAYHEWHHTKQIPKLEYIN